MVIIKITAEVTNNAVKGDVRLMIEERSRITIAIAPMTDTCVTVDILAISSLVQSNIMSLYSLE
ncbi:hypothetical protein BOM23_22375 [Erwinia sp. OLMDLW33]|nr:hypothetical protein BOM23_22375 [Erwinia sp. OLMDLW33]